MVIASSATRSSGLEAVVFRVVTSEQVCCSRSNIMTSATKIAHSCVCEGLCRANSSCLFFSHAPFPFGNCEFCSSLMNCTKREVRAQRTWERVPEDTPANLLSPLEEVIHARQAAPKCPKTRFVVQNTVNSKVTKRYTDADPRLAMSRFLGTAVGTLLEDRLPEQSCSSSGGEEATFRAVCAPVIAEMDAHLDSTRGRRGLFILFEGKSEWGWGNLLPAVFAMHWLCMHVQRFCYLQIQDQDLGSMLGYANGERWFQPLKDLKRIYRKGIRRCRERHSNPGWSQPHGAAIELPSACHSHLHQHPATRSAVDG